ncbi:MAG: thioredoxin family protein [Halioglobus sp.]
MFNAFSGVARAVLLLSALVISTSGTQAADDYDNFPAPVTAAEVERQFEEAKATAVKQQQLLMVVLGANWCHDSRDFSDKLEQNEIASQLSPRYHVLKVNVGYFDTLQPLLGLFDIPVLYGTPTVIVVEPATGQVLNNATLSYWRSSETHSVEETLAYFSDYPAQPKNIPEPALSPALVDALAQIDSFEKEQGERITGAFVAAGQVMAVSDVHNPPQRFIDQWKNLGAVRGRMPDDLAALRAEARTQDAAGTNPIVLEYPTYSLFTDDTE